MDGYLTVTGGRKLKGEIGVSGAKNAVLPILFSTLLFDEPAELTNVPSISDVETSLEILRSLGSKVICDPHGKTTVVPGNQGSFNPPPTLCNQLRASSYLLGVLAGSGRSGTVPLPGGCGFACRPLDLHLSLFSAMGMTCRITGDGISLSGRAVGCRFAFPYRSVGATVNGILSALGAAGETVLSGIALEPHIFALVSFLRSAGAKISFTPPDTLRILGGARLHATSYRVPGDMIEAGTYLSFAAATGGFVTLHGVSSEELNSTLDFFRRIGCRVATWKNDLSLAVDRPLSGTALQASPHPGFPTDLQPPATALLSTVAGESRVSDLVFPTRFGYIPGLRKMGADATFDGREAVLHGSAKPTGAEVTAEDLRAGAAYLTLALAAEGESRIYRFDRICRGYDSLPEKIASLGGSVSISGGDA